MSNPHFSVQSIGVISSSLANFVTKVQQNIAVSATFINELTRFFKKLIPNGIRCIFLFILVTKLFFENLNKVTVTFSICQDREPSNPKNIYDKSKYEDLV
jgi:hypothetical protein